MGPDKSADGREDYGESSLYADLLNEDYTLYDLVPFENIKTLLEAHHRVIRVPIGLVSPESELLLNVGWQDICSRFHRVHPETAEACRESNTSIQARLFNEGGAAVKCSNGLWDIAMPILVGNRHLATVFIGQFLYEDETVEMDFFRAQASRYGYDEQGYLKALEAVPRLSRPYVNEIIEYTATLVGLVAELGLKNLQLTREIRERQMAEYALREGERRYRALIENIPGAVYLCLNDDAYTTIYMSDAMEAISGHTAQSMIDNSMSIMSLIHPDDRATVVRLVDEGVAGDGPYVLSYRLLRKDGSYIWVEERGQGVRDDSGALRFLQGIIFDVSARCEFEETRVKIEGQIARAHKLESLGILAGGIAHDFNNLLVGILGHAEMAREDTEKGTPVYESLEAIIASAHGAADLTHKMLAYSGKGHFITERTDLNGIVKGLMPLFHTKSPDGFEFHYELQARLPEIVADVEQINQVIISLVNNAVESYLGSGGGIYIRTGVFEYEKMFPETLYLGQDIPKGNFAYLEVEDKGCGMDGETRQRLCDPFFSTKFTGRGLSMAAVLGIVRGHNAHLKVDSTPGKGTAIRIFFPTSSETTLKATPTMKDTDPPRDILVLLVDDEDIVRNAARKMLRRAGYDVVEAEDGKAALEVVRNNGGSIACVILDYTMPNMNGEETLKEIREISPDMPVILSSGYPPETTKTCFTEQGSVTFLQKPYDVAALRDALGKALKDAGR